MKIYIFAVFLLTGCATEADRYCPVILSQGVASTPTDYAACDPARTDACGSWECGRPFASPVGQCARPCVHDVDCQAGAVVAAGRSTYCNEGHCLLTCRDGTECRPGTTCRVHSLRGANVPLCLPIACPL